MFRQIGTPGSGSPTFIKQLRWVYLAQRNGMWKRKDKSNFNDVNTSNFKVYFGVCLDESILMKHEMNDSVCHAKRVEMQLHPITVLKKDRSE